MEGTAWATQSKPPSTVVGPGAVSSPRSLSPWPAVWGDLPVIGSWTQTTLSGGKSFLYLEGTWEAHQADDTFFSGSYSTSPRARSGTSARTGPSSCCGTCCSFRARVPRVGMSVRGIWLRIQQRGGTRLKEATAKFYKQRSAKLKLLEVSYCGG